MTRSYCKPRLKDTQHVHVELKNKKEYFIVLNNSENGYYLKPVQGEDVCIQEFEQIKLFTHQDIWWCISEKTTGLAIVDISEKQSSKLEAINMAFQRFKLNGLESILNAIKRSKPVSEYPEFVTPLKIKAPVFNSNRQPGDPNPGKCSRCHEPMIILHDFCTKGHLAVCQNGSCNNYAQPQKLLLFPKFETIAEQVEKLQGVIGIGKRRRMDH